MSQKLDAPRRQPEGELWTLEEVASYFKVSDRTIREWRGLDATFPQPLDLPGRSVRWYRQDVVHWALSLRGVLD